MPKSKDFAKRQPDLDDALDAFTTGRPLPKGFSVRRRKKIEQNEVLVNGVTPQEIFAVALNKWLEEKTANAK